MDLKSEKISRPLVIDNSLPVVGDFRVDKQNNRLSVSFTARDSHSHIMEAKYLIRPDEWQTVFPEDGICDSKNESFRFSVTLPQGADDLIVVHVKDRHGNIGITRSTF
jgi:hypothetical protein